MIQMDANLKIILANIFDVIAWLLLVYSFWKNKDNKLLWIQLLANFFFLLNYLFLDAYTGLWVVFFEMFRDYLYIKLDDDKKTFYISLPIYALIGITNFEGFFSLFSIGASLNDGYSLIYHGKRVVWLGILTYVLWLIYDLSVMSYVNAIAEAIVVISNITILFVQKDEKKIIRRD